MKNLRNYFTPFGLRVTLVTLSITTGAILILSRASSAPAERERNEEERTHSIMSSSSDLLRSLEDQAESGTGRKADCQMTMIVELIPEKTYRAVVLCDDGKLLLTNIIDVTRFGADDQLFWQASGFNPAKKQPRPL
jgi:hypothetical protein